MNNESLRERFKYSDLYPIDTTIIQLKKLFRWVSIAGNSIPTKHSNCRRLDSLIINENSIDNCQVLKTTIHRNNTVTLRIKVFDSVNNYRFHNLNI